MSQAEKLALLIIFVNRLILFFVNTLFLPHYYETLIPSDLVPPPDWLQSRGVAVWVAETIMVAIVGPAILSFLCLVAATSAAVRPNISERPSIYGM